MFKDIFTWQFILGRDSFEILISLISFAILFLSIADLILTWTADEKPYGWETSIGLVGLLVPVLLGSIKYIYLKRKQCTGNIGNEICENGICIEKARSI